MTYLAIALVVLLVSAFVAWDLWRSKRKRKAPVADFWIGPVGFEDGQTAGPEVARVAWNIEAFTGRKLEPVVIVLRPDPIPLPTGGIAAGVYHSTRKGWDRPWIEIYSWAALAHELLHHATGMEDTQEFRELFERFKLRTP